MNSRPSSSLNAGFLVIAFGSCCNARSLATEDGAAAARLTVSLIEAEPAAILKVVAGQVAASPACACEVVKAAITASGTDARLVAEIVKAAVEAAPAELPTILACAASVAPEATPFLSALFEDETAGSGKGVAGKEPAGKNPDDEIIDCFVSYRRLEIGEQAPGLGGVYLTSPARGRAVRPVSDGAGTETVTRKITVVRPVGVPVPVTAAEPGFGAGASGSVIGSISRSWAVSDPAAAVAWLAGVAEQEASAPGDTSRWLPEIPQEPNAAPGRGR